MLLDRKMAEFPITYYKQNNKGANTHCYLGLSWLALSRIAIVNAAVMLLALSKVALCLTQM